MDSASYAKLKQIENPRVMAIVEHYMELMQPARVTVISDDPADVDYVRQGALEKGEERKLAMAGHTIHYDGYCDQARDKEHTRVLIAPGEELGQHINTLDRETGLSEIRKLMQGIMRGKEMLVRFFCLAPLHSRFSIPALQLTDSFYVAHSEDILYRSGYAQFEHMQDGDSFFTFIHSAGMLDEKRCSQKIDERRVYIDLQESRVFSINNQYAGNSLGLKKLALRLAIHKANREDWLAEHMFIMGVRPENKDRVSYFTGAFPSACGKTSTAMLPGQSIIGDDIAYLRAWEDGSCHAVNIEHGIFGIISGVNPSDDPLIYRCLTTPRELIFSNVLVNDGKPYWLDMGSPTPDTGINHHGKWRAGDQDEDGKSIPLAHKNARYTIRIHELDNVDENAENPDGVRIDGIIYGGRDSDTNVPITESLSWKHGVFLGASLESETTAATLGAEGRRSHSPMANLDFIVIPLSKYIAHHIRFGEHLKHCPRIFCTNYFLKDGNGDFLNDKLDKKVWVLWAESRIHHESDAILTPLGYIPLYSDLAELFGKVLQKRYTREDYEQQFSLRIDRLLAKLERMEKAFAHETLPPEFAAELSGQRQRLSDLRKKHGKDIISPFAL